MKESNSQIYVVKVRRYIRDCDGTVYEQHWNIGAFFNRDRAVEFVRQKRDDILQDYEKLGQKLKYEYWRDMNELEFPNLRNGFLNADLCYDEAFITNVHPFKFEFVVEPIDIYDSDEEDDDD